jgi:hypothetical protein
VIETIHAEFPHTSWQRREAISPAPAFWVQTRSTALFHLCMVSPFYLYALVQPTHSGCDLRPLYGADVCS